MAEAPKPKYDSLPGIDTAPDVYETPDLAEDVSTIQASTTISESSEDDNDEETGVRHTRFQTDSARSRFQPSRVDARGVDFSDSVGAQRRSYRTSTRGGQRRRGGDVLGEDSGGDEDEESFSRKLMRVRRELLELEEEYQDRVKSGDKTKIEEGDPKEVMEFISDKVDSIYASRRGGVRGAEPLLEKTIQKFQTYAPFEPSLRIQKAITNQPPLPGSQVQRSQLDFVLGQAADFDKRINGLENALGLQGGTMPELGEKAPFPVFATLEKLEQTIGMVADASSGGLEAAVQQVKKMITDAEELKKLRNEGTPAPNGEIKPYAADQEAKVNALYGTLPTIDKLSPLLPLVLERLRTLRLVHTSAWQADEVLTELEHRQSKQEDEITKWEKSLEVVEKDIKTCEDSMQQNMQVVGDWVKGLEEKIAKLPQ
ncbi:Dynamitin-domain-containing protein [Lophiotrema nucula]|uniref:Dynamitin-domain-containing protein n=1 Tax=Lophiotrema nucula TaxID=690887 RepID=A0A6A5ZFQ5_9PLEO|nr:Dynamitin-domain-containing protein [Lophiotrema nucula]